MGGGNLPADLVTVSKSSSQQICKSGRFSDSQEIC